MAAASRRPGLAWATMGAPGNASSRSLTLAPTVLNRFTVSNAANPLPMTLLDFTARVEGPAALRLHWRTASELTNAGFHGGAQPRRARLPGPMQPAGGEQQRHRPRLHPARRPPAGRATRLYYRLRQTDLDGTAHCAPVRTAALTAAATGFVVYATHVPSGQGTTYLSTGPASAGTPLVLDVLGRTVRTVPVDGRAQGEVPLAGLATGAYVLRCTTARASFSGCCVVE